MANIKDVAKHAEVGLGTVSRYLNGHNVTDINKKKIETAIKELKFSVNPIARSMKTKKSMTVAIVVPRLANIFSMKIIESIENYLEPFGYSIIVCDCGESEEKEIERLRFVVDKMVDGIVLMTSSKTDKRIKNVIKTIPMVLVDRIFTDNSFDSVTVENRKSTYLSVNECIKNGNQKFAVIAGPQHISTAKERLLGIMNAFKDNSVNAENHIICECKYEIADGYNATKKVLLSNPDAIFASNYELTIGAIKALNEKKLVLGKDINLIGFDNLELINVYPYSMTIIAQPIEEIGRQAAKCLIDRMEENSAPVKNIVLANEIIKI